MSDPKQAREFWITHRRTYVGIFLEADEHPVPGGLHVIEYSALESLREEVAFRKEAAEKVQKLAETACSERDALKAELERAKSELLILVANSNSVVVENEKLRAEVKRLTTQFQVTTVDLVNADAELAAARATLREYEHEAYTIEEMRSERDALKAENIQLEKRIQGYHDTENAVIREVRAENERLEKVHDMDALIMSGLRRVLATSRMALNGNTKPLELALAEYDKNKLPVDTSDAEERLQNTIISQLQRAHKVYCDIIEAERDSLLKAREGK